MRNLFQNLLIASVILSLNCAPIAAYAMPEPVPATQTDKQKAAAQKKKEAEKRMMDSKRDILMYGSDKVFEAFNKYLCSSTNNSNPTLPMKYFLKLICEIRKDMCGKNTSVNEKDILLNLMQNEDEVKKYKGLYK